MRKVANVDSLREELREILVQQKAADFFQVMQTPRVQGLSEVLMQRLLQSIKGVVVSHFGGAFEEESDINALFELMNLEAVLNIDEYFSNTARLQAIAEGNARKKFMTQDEIKARYGKDGDLAIRLKAKKWPEDAMQTLLGADDRMAAFLGSNYQLQDKFFGKLVAIAKREGIETATSRTVPTPEEYTAFHVARMEAFREWWVTFQRALKMVQERKNKDDGENAALGHVMSLILQQLGTMVADEFQKVFLEVEVKEIYG